MMITKQERLEKDQVADCQYITFFHEYDQWGVFSNFSISSIFLPHPFTQRLIEYPTGEHRFQAMKATSADRHDYVNRANSALEAKRRGREIELRDDWGSDVNYACWFVMCELVITKACQHPQVLEALLETGHNFLYEDSATDDIWGWRHRNNYNGKNLLGKAWMQARWVRLGI